MYRIDSMYEPMVEALLAARAENKADRWMACVAFWLGRQQIYNISGLLACARLLRSPSGLPAADKDAVLDQLSRQETALVDAAGDWPETPSSLVSVVAGWSAGARSRRSAGLRCSQSATRSRLAASCLTACR